MNPLANFLAYLGIALAALGHETAAFATFGGSLLAQAAPAIIVYIARP